MNLKNCLSPAEELAARSLIQLALTEDLGTSGDRTSLALIPTGTIASAAFVVRTPGVIAGLPVAAEVIKSVSSRLNLEISCPDGQLVSKGTVVATVSGPTQAMLVAERTALNFLQRLSGIATLTRRFCDAVSGLNVQVLDTRKTTPGWRLLEKYAVRMGGGTNHRMNLSDAILIKDNHIAGIGGDIRQAIRAAREFPGNQGLPVEIEVDSLAQLELALNENPEIVLLDNMSNEQLRSAVELRNRRSAKTLLEASGGVNLTTIRSIAETGVDRISVGALTHSAQALDIGLDFIS